MIQVLKATQEQYNKLNGYTNGLHSIQFIKDANNNWVIGQEILNDISYQFIWGDIKLMPLIDWCDPFIPPSGTTENYSGYTGTYTGNTL
jgi:hypothetical protein